MKTFMQRAFSLLLTITMALSVITITPTKLIAMPASPTGNVEQRIEALRQIFPNGSYFSKNKSACSHGRFNVCDNCSLTGAMQGLGYPNRMGMPESWTCVAFSMYAFYYVFGTPYDTLAYNGRAPSGASLVSQAQARPGDIYVWNNAHMAMYLGNGKFFESNFEAPNKVSHGASLATTAPSYIVRANNYDEIERQSSTPIDKSLNERVIGSQITRGQNINQWECLLSDNRKFVAVMQGDGNFVVYNTQQALFSTSTDGSGGTFLALQNDGNLVIYNNEPRAVWSPNIHNAHTLSMQDDGNLVAYDSGGRAVWASNTVNSGTGVFNPVNNTPEPTPATTPEPTPTPTATPEPTPISTPEPTPTSTPEPTQLPAPTPTTTPEPTQTPVPTPPPTPEPTPPHENGNNPERGLSNDIILNATVTEVGVKFDWTPNDNTLGYRIYRSSVPGIEGISITDFPILPKDGAFAGQYVDVNAEPETQYYYTIRTVEAEAELDRETTTIIPEKLGLPSKELSVMTGDIIKFEASPDDGTRRFILMTVDVPTMLVNDEEMEIDPGRGTTPIIIDGRTLTPIRTIIETMGGDVGWDSADSKVTLNVFERSLEMWIGSRLLRLDGADREMDIAPDTINGRTMLPLRFVSENVGCEIAWIGSTRQIIIVFYGVD
ncbi:MAG: stalk domain-containing protein [Defluviitaleaceae bacterium]|nr:stalk domain-containing protein [Defluviitaleaceae bacterium]